MRHTTQRLKATLPLYTPLSKDKHRLHKTQGDNIPDDKELYARRITELQLELEKLNILDHPLRIVDICNQIGKLQKEISRLDN